MAPEFDRIAATLPGPARGFATGRTGGASAGPFASFNLSDAAGDAEEAVAANRADLSAALPSTPRWLRQVHGASVLHLDDWVPGSEADAAWTDRPGQVVAVLIADCLPVLLADRQGRCVAAAHAGWRGLAAGVLEATVRALPAAPGSLLAWIGPRIGPEAYEVDAPVRDAFPEYPECFAPSRPGHWRADLPSIAAARLQAAGVGEVRDCGLCTASDPERFFSHRRDGRTGRQAALAWLDAASC